ncbi:molybdenum cofactor guanylyltransferase [Glycomyces sp. TRM65418]|uniref:molybdenum cofactor guanylyltransferase n=1 Tax=Glycomyces sp. TRM65418 TaxID=2867006 RepID=UPI001CE50E17|nr:molybdenum cofactor guanylyltransferase [Glycomyces sp. TRM65418]MCC3764769.1 molybdenum cofactor guanylyltransferase [Glycomyces sp. TRM65418]QZD54423.1 molybdenum cofactor guanylyltransferase [Glycomyces sp. TRM65418]
MAEHANRFAAIVLVGGRARRFAGCAKSELVVGGATILERMLAATEEATPRVVVGARPADARPLPEGALQLVENPPRSGPARAVQAGLAKVPDDCERVAILGGDLPFLCSGALRLLNEQANAAGPKSGAVFCDNAGRRQWLCGLWPTALVRQNAAGIEPGAPARLLFTGIDVETVTWEDPTPPPWFDCDTPDDLTQARTWAETLS